MDQLLEEVMIFIFQINVTKIILAILTYLIHLEKMKVLKNMN
jgi:hypothetical protein